MGGEESLLLKLTRKEYQIFILKQIIGHILTRYKDLFELPPGLGLKY